MPASNHPGMGAIPYSGGVAFRVWAPFAAGVAVIGDFNAWSQTANPLTPEGTSGNWSTDVPGASPSQQYQYVVSSRGAIMPPRIDPRAKADTNSAGKAIIYDEGAFAWTGTAFTMPAWNDLVLYEIHIGTFNDPDPHSNPQGNPGTFATAIQKLPYLRDLGINAVSVMPVAEFPGNLDEGYDIADPFAVESSYGGPDNLKAFVQAAHGYGIAVILDVVYNHFGPTTDLGYSLWCFDGWSQGGYGGIYFYQDGRAWTKWGDKVRPDYGRGEVRQYIFDNAFMWLEDYQIDGLRFDSVSYIRNIYGNDNDPANDIPDGWSLVQWINQQVQALQPWKITIAEDMHNNAWITKPTGAGGAGFSSQWDADFVDTVRPALIVSDDDYRDVVAVASAIGTIYNGDAFQRVIYTESHDEASNGNSRIPVEISPEDVGSYWARKRSTLGAVVALTAPGIPMLLQGQEFLEDGYFSDDNPIDWSELNTYSGMHDLCSDAIQLRRNWFNNTRGLRGQNVNVFFAGSEDKVVAFHRWDQGGAGDDVIVVLNFRDVAYDSYTIGFPLPGVWFVRFNSDWNGYSPDFGNTNSYNTTANWGACQGMPCTGNIGIGPYTAIILSQ